MKFASLCVLAYKRPELLERCLKSLKKTADYPYELIVNYDGLDSLNDWRTPFPGQISKEIFNYGKNRGVGKSFQNCLGLVEGEYIVKIDTDLIFKPHWLSTIISILENNTEVAAVSPFDYNHYDPNDERFKPEVCHLGDRNNCIVVKDFVSSIYAFRTSDLDVFHDEHGAMLEDGSLADDGFHTSLSNHRGDLAITKEDYCTNEGFGVGKSVYISGTADHPVKTPTFNEPLIFS